MARDRRVQMWIEQCQEKEEAAWDLRVEFYGKKRDAERIAKENEAARLEAEAEILRRYIRAADAYATRPYLLGDF